MTQDLRILRVLRFDSVDDASRYLHAAGISDRSTLLVKDRGAHAYYTEMGWLDDLLPAKHRKRFESIDDARAFVEKCGASNRTSLSRIDQSAYKAMLREGWLDDIFGEKRVDSTPDIEFDSIEDAREYVEGLGCKNKSALSVVDRKSYVELMKLGWIDEVFDGITMKPSRVAPDVETARKFIREDLDIHRRGDLSAQFASLYQHVWRRGWLDEIFPEKEAKTVARRGRKPKHYDTLARILELFDIAQERWDNTEDKRFLNFHSFKMKRTIDGVEHVLQPDPDVAELMHLSLHSDQVLARQVLYKYRVFPRWSMLEPTFMDHVIAYRDAYKADATRRIPDFVTKMRPSPAYCAASYWESGGVHEERVMPPDGYDFD